MICLLVISLFCFEVYAEEFNLKKIIEGQKINVDQNMQEISVNPKDIQKNSTFSAENPVLKELAQSNVKTLVFISRSMPEKVILTLLEQGAGRQNVVFIFKGWGHGSLDDMLVYANALEKKLSKNAQASPPNIIIHPQAFRTYQVNKVPAVVHQDTNEKWYMVQGTHNIADAIVAIQKRQFSNVLSQQWTVSEPDQAAVLAQKAKEIDWKAESKKAITAIQDNMKGSITLPYAIESKKIKFTPIISAGYDIRDPKTKRVIYPKGTRFNVLALDPEGQRILAVIDGNDPWQIEFAQSLQKLKPNTVVLYTRLGTLAQSNVIASPINKQMAKSLRITVVPSVIKQIGTEFELSTYRR